MIIDAILSFIGWSAYIFWWPFYKVLDFVPDGTTTLQAAADSFAYFISRAHGFDFILPVHEALFLFRLSIGLSMAISLFYSGLFLVNYIRGR